jgi:hypothetical protein
MRVRCRERANFSPVAFAAAIAIAVVFRVVRGGQNQLQVSASEVPRSMESGGTEENI